MPEIRSFLTHEASDDVLGQIRLLLVDAFEGDVSDEDWEHTLGGMHVVGFERGALVAHAAVVPRTLQVGDRPFRAGYVEGVGVAPSRQGRGFGSLAMARLSEEVHGRFELGALSTDRHSFYERRGWERWLGPTFVRSGPETIRTEDEDDGVMVLRFGPSRDVDLTASLTCEPRPGDDW